MAEEKLNKSEISLSELDDRLMADDGSLKKEILEKLRGYQDGLRPKLNGGDFSPEEFEAAKQLMKGLKEAEEIIMDLKKS